MAQGSRSNCKTQIDRSVQDDKSRLDFLADARLESLQVRAGSVEFVHPFHSADHSQCCLARFIGETGRWARGLNSKCIRRVGLSLVEG